jgi:demethylmenaquinone methyltransferase/2-methoxy-6-polyprenyl-1,4-benzoquinol methylase
MEGPKAETTKAMFSDVAKTYDLANNALTFGLAHQWRNKIVKLANTPSDGAVLDCATGTGDLAIAFKKRLGEKSHVVGQDFCKEMLDFAPQKAKAKNLDIKFELGDVMSLPYEDQSFDTVTIAYGIRNVEDPELGLKEMWRVLKPGGRLLVLETGEGKGLLNWPITFYTRHVTPFVGGLVTKKKQAYDYLSKSSQKFPSQENFLDLGKELPGLKDSHYKTLMFGASYIYVFIK